MDIDRYDLRHLFNHAALKQMLQGMLDELESK